MFPNLRVMVVIGFLTLTILPFTNCGQYAQPAGEATAESAEFVPCNANCITPVTENLSVKVNMGSATNYGVPANLFEFNLGGDCNEGGYPTNEIRWELQLNGVTVRRSAMGGMGGAVAGPVHGRCINGRYLLYVYLRSIPEDPVDRTGLRYGAGEARAAYDLSVEIFGLNMVNDPAPKRNAVKGRTRVALSAL